MARRSIGTPLTIGIVLAVLLVALAVGWQVLAGELWRGETDEAKLRARLDTVLARVRRRLRVGGVRTDLVRFDGSGCVELVLYPHDTLDDRT